MTNEELFTAVAIHSWKQVLGRFSEGVAARSDEELQKRVAPNKNRLYYLLGHLTSVHDRMLPLLGVGERLHPELDDAFITNPDGAISDPISATDLKAAWNEVNARLTSAFENFAHADWLKKHTAVSDEDFAKDPTRNRLAVLLSRTNHLSFHTGQAVLTK